MKPLILALSHNIYINKEQEENIINKIPIELMGVCVPVWHCGGKSSEPAKEVFCKYYIHNQENDFPVEILKNGFKLNLPQIPNDFKKDKELTDQEWKGLKEKDLIEWYEKNTMPLNALNLKDKGTLCYMQYDKFMFKRKLSDIVHNVNIKTEEILLNSLV